MNTHVRTASERKPAAGKPVKITETAFRDAHQSLLATRMKTEDMLAVADTVDSIGYHSVEMWGGATFDTCLRYLNEDPWDRLRTLRKRLKNTKFQMLLRGQNLVGYHHYADDVVEAFVSQCSKGRHRHNEDSMRSMTEKHGKSHGSMQRCGAHVQACVVYTLSPVHDIEHYVSTAKTLEQMGADSVCVRYGRPLNSLHFIRSDNAFERRGFSGSTAQPLHKRNGRHGVLKAIAG